MSTDEVARPSDTIANDVPQNANTILSETTSSIHERLDIPEEELSEEQLRALYDDEVSKCSELRARTNQSLRNWTGSSICSPLYERVLCLPECLLTLLHSVCP